MNRRILFVAIALLLACGGETESSVFQGAKQVVISSPQSCKRFLLTIQDNDDPGIEDDFFQFGGTAESAGIAQKRVFAAIFKERPQVQEGRIINPQDALWAWHSGMRSDATASGGKLRFTDGTLTDDQGAPQTLESCRFNERCGDLASRFDRTNARTYYFAVWAWDDEREIAYFSDQQAAFCFTSDPALKGEACPSTCSP